MIIEMMTQFDLPPKDLDFSENAENLYNNSNEALHLDNQMTAQIKKDEIVSNNHLNTNIELFSNHESPEESLQMVEESEKEDTKWFDLSDYNNTQSFATQLDPPSMNADSRSVILPLIQPVLNDKSPQIHLQADRSQNDLNESFKENSSQNANLFLEKSNSSTFKGFKDHVLNKNSSKYPPEFLHYSAEDDNKTIRHVHSEQMPALNYEVNQVPRPNFQ
jgi:hypothetical protein